MVRELLPMSYNVETELSEDFNLGRLLVPRVPTYRDRRGCHWRCGLKRVSYQTGSIAWNFTIPRAHLGIHGATLPQGFFSLLSTLSGEKSRQNATSPDP